MNSAASRSVVDALRAARPGGTCRVGETTASMTLIDLLPYWCSFSALWGGEGWDEVGPRDSTALALESPTSPDLSAPRGGEEMGQARAVATPAPAPYPMRPSGRSCRDWACRARATRQNAAP